MEGAMSSNQKRRSFIKSKFLSNSFSKVVTKSFTAVADAGTGSNHHSSSKVKPLPPPVWMDSSSKHSNYAYYFTPPPPAGRSAAAATTTAAKQLGNPSCAGKSYGDENVDKKAACYISNVRERFKLERFDWDHTTNHHEAVH